MKESQQGNGLVIASCTELAGISKNWRSHHSIPKNIYQFEVMV